MNEGLIFLKGFMFSWELLLILVLLIGKWNIGDFEVTNSKLKYPMLIVLILSAVWTVAFGY